MVVVEVVVVVAVVVVVVVVVVLRDLSLMFWHLINTTAYHSG